MSLWWFKCTAIICNVTPSPPSVRHKWFQADCAVIYLTLLKIQFWSGGIANLTLSILLQGVRRWETLGMKLDSLHAVQHWKTIETSLPCKQMHKKAKWSVLGLKCFQRSTYISWYLCLSLSETEGPIDDAACSKSDWLICIPPAPWSLAKSVFETLNQVQ